MSVELLSSGRDQPLAIPPKHLRYKGRICDNMLPKPP